MSIEKPDHIYSPHESENLEFITYNSAIGSNSKHVEYSTNGSSGAGELDFPSSLDQSTSKPHGGLDDNNSRIRHLLQSSAENVEAEHNTTIREALRLYPKAIGWSALLSLTIVMEGYDLTIINGFYAFPEFKKAYGVRVGADDYQITTAWQSGLTNGAIVGEILGLLFNGQLTERYGYRKTLMFAMVCLVMFIFLAVFAFNIGMLMASEVLCGLSWGVFQTLSTTYAAEIMPVALRAYLTSNVNMCWLVGQLVGVGVLRGLVNLQSEWSYRIPFSLQWMWAVPILIATFMAPESPWWYVRHGMYDKAKHSLARLTRSGMNYDADKTISLMKKTNEIEKYLTAGAGYLDCFRGTNLRRTEIACMVWSIQTLCGSPLTGFAPYFYVQAGFDPARAFDLSLGMYGMAIVGGMISWFLLPVVGRRTLYLWGTFLIFLILIAGGAVGTIDDTNRPWVSWTLGSLVILLTFVYDTTIGPVCYSLVAEIPSTRLRIKTVVLARVAYNLCGLVSNILMPKMLNPTAWNWKGKTCFLWAGTCLLCYVWCFFRLPEPKGLTYLELDLLFEKKVPARKFHRITNVLAEAGYFDIEGPEKGGHDFCGVQSYA